MIPAQDEEEIQQYDLVEVVQEIDHEIASKSFAVIKAHQSGDEWETRCALIKLRRALIRNTGLIEDIQAGLGKEYV